MKAQPAPDRVAPRFLRGLGWTVGLVGAALAAPAAFVDSVEFSYTLFFSGAAQSVFYGGLLWAAGTIIGHLDALGKGS